jgi:dihydrofolate reductase
MIKGIVAINNNNGIGFDNNILFNIKADQQRFKELTLSQRCVMGSETYFSLPKFAQPLPKRTSYVLSRKLKSLGEISIKTEDQESTHVFLYDDPEKLLAKARGYHDHLWIIGGEQIYTLFYPLMKEIEVTQIFSDKPANKFFPAFKDDFEMKATSEIFFDEKNQVKFQYQTWVRKAS